MPSAGKAADSTAAPQPPKTSQKVPKNSATAGRTRSFPMALPLYGRLPATRSAASTARRFLAQAQAARDDAAKDFAGATLDRQLGGDQRRHAQRFLEAVVVAVGRRIAGRRRQEAHLVGQRLFPVGAEILDDGGLDRRGF